MKLTDLDLSPNVAEAFQSAISRQRGLTIVCGPTGQGKTDTAEALIGELAVSREIVQLHDINNVRRPIDVWCAIDAGDLRSVEETAMAVDLALTTQVIGVIRSGFSLGALGRFIDMGIDTGRIRDAAPIVLTQQLCKRLCVRCRFPKRAADVELRATGFERDVLEFTAGYVYEHRGCEACSQGFRGNVAIFEAMRPTITDAGEVEVKEVWSLLVHDGLLKVMHGATTLGELRYHYDPHVPGMLHPEVRSDRV